MRPSGSVREDVGTFIGGGDDGVFAVLARRLRTVG